MIVKIDNLSHDFRGITKVSGKVTFIPDTIPGEVVNVKITESKSKFNVGNTISYIETSEDRTNPICPYYELCGGCDTSYIKYDKVLEYKRNIVSDILSRYAGILFNPTIISDGNIFGYRNKILLRVMNGKLSLVKEGSNELVNISKCLLVNDNINRIIEIMNNICLDSVNDVTIRGTNEIMVIVNGDISKDLLIDNLKNNVCSIILNDDVIYGKDYITIDVGNYSYAVYPKSFFQINTKMIEKLYDKVKEYAGTGNRLLDLYCGAGTIGIYLSDNFNYVDGVEVNSFAIEGANLNKSINNIKNTCFECKKASDISNTDYDVIVVDPPRAGLDNITINKLLESNASRIVYVSCNPITLARDIKILKDKYEVDDMVLFDMFPNTKHVESILLLHKKKNENPYKIKEKVDFEISNSDLETIYPIASNKAKLDENYMEKSRKITYELQSENKGYYALWKKIVDTSVSEIKKLYDKLYVSFDLWNGESDASKYIPEMMEYLKEKKLLTESDGALIIDISKKEDTKEMPPLILIKSNGAVSYEATDLATIWERMKNYSPDEIWYVVDNRQELHFEQVFRAAYKAGIVPESVKLEFIGFGTMNGNDGKPFKTRDGGVMSLSNLLSLAKEETYKKLNPGVPDNKKDEISTQIAVSALKYADLLPNRETDYIFDLTKFTDMNGKTGPYLLYSTIRIRSLLNKANDSNIPYTSLKKIVNNYDREVILNLLNLKSVINKSLKDKSLNEITEYLYKLTNSYNNFYSENRILTEEDDEKRESWLYLSKIVYNVNMYLLNILGIEVPEKM